MNYFYLKMGFDAHNRDYIGTNHIRLERKNKHAINRGLTLHQKYEY